MKKGNLTQASWGVAASMFCFIPWALADGIAFDVPNGDFETDPSVNPGRWIHYVSQNSEGSQVWDDAVSRGGGGPGHSLRLELTAVYDADYVRDAGSVIAIGDAPGATAGYVYELFGYVKTESFLGRAFLGARWYNSGAFIGGLTTGLEDGSFVSGTADWTPLRVVAQAPAGADALVPYLVASAYHDEVGGSVWFDDITALEHAEYKSVQARLRPVILVSAGLTTLNRYQNVVLENMGDSSATLVVDVPAEVTLDASFSPPDRTSVVVRTEGNYNRSEWDKGTVTSASWGGTLQLETAEAPGSLNPMYVFYQWDAVGGLPASQQEEVAIPLEAIEIPMAPRLERLRTFIGWSGYNQSTYAWFPEWVDTLVHLGVPVLAHHNSINRQSHRDAIVPASTEALDAGLMLGATSGIQFTTSAAPYAGDELAVLQNGSTSNKGCPALRDGSYLDEIADYQAAAAMGIELFYFDEEDSRERAFSDRAIARFHAEYGHDGDDPKDFRDSSPADTDYQNFAQRDADFVTFHAQLGTEIWSDVSAAAKAGLADACDTDVPSVCGRQPLVGDYSSVPGKIDNHISDFDKLYPHTFAYSAPVLYPPLALRERTLHFVGKYVRQYVLGALALTNDNLVQNGGLEQGTGDCPDGFTCTGAGIEWISLPYSTGTTKPPRPIANGVRALAIAADQGEVRSDDFAARSGEEIVFAATAKYSGLSTRTLVTCCVQGVWLDSTDAELGSTQIECGPRVRDGHWQRIAVLGSAPAGTAKAQVRVFAPGAEGTGWFDDIMAVRPNQVENASLEFGTSALPDGFDDWGTDVAASWDDQKSYQGVQSARLDVSAAMPAEGGIQTAAGEGVGIWPGVAYQASAQVASRDLDGQAVLRLAWLDSGNSPIGSSVEVVHGEPASDWTQVTLSSVAPEGSVAARLRVGVSNALSGTVWFDDLDFRVDGPYSIPICSAGTGAVSTPTPAEVEGRWVLEEILESYVAGAQGVSLYNFAYLGGEDWLRMAHSALMLSAFEHIVADGRPMAPSRIHVAEPAHVLGMEYDGDALLLVRSYEPEPVVSDVSLASSRGGWLFSIQPDGSAALVGQMDSDTDSFAVSIDPGDQETARARLYWFRHNHSPVAAELIEDREATQGQAFHFAFAASAFVDEDADMSDMITYQARLDGGAPLPGWLGFAGATRTFSGTPSAADVGAVDIEVVATDSFGAWDSRVFTLTVLGAGTGGAGGAGTSGQSSSGHAQDDGCSCGLAGALDRHPPWAALLAAGLCVAFGLRRRSQVGAAVRWRTKAMPTSTASRVSTLLASSLPKSFGALTSGGYACSVRARSSTRCCSPSIRCSARGG